MVGEVTTVVELPSVDGEAPDDEDDEEEDAIEDWEGRVELSWG